MPLVRKWHSDGKLSVNCILKISGILNMPQAFNIPRFCTYKES